MSVTRFDCGCGACGEDPDGGMVDYEDYTTLEARVAGLEKEKEDAWYQGFAIAAAVVCDLSGSLNSHEVFTENGVMWEDLKAHNVDIYDLRRIAKDLGQHGIRRIKRSCRK